MPATISLHAIVNELSCMVDEFTVYLNKETGAIVTVSNEDLGHAEDEALAEEDDETEADGDAQDYPDWQQESAYGAA